MAGSAGGSATGHLREHRGDANDALAQVGVVSGREKVDDGGDLADASERDAVVVAARIAGIEPARDAGLDLEALYSANLVSGFIDDQP